MTKSKNSINYPPLFASAKYYSKEDFQFPVTAVSKIVTSQTVLKKNSGITLLYFRDSNGKIVGNIRLAGGRLCAWALTIISSSFRETGP